MRKFIALALIAFLSRTEQARIKLRKNHSRKWVRADGVFAGQNQNQNNIIIDDKGKNNDIIVAGTNDEVFLDDKNGKVTSDFVFAGQNQNQNQNIIIDDKGKNNDVIVAGTNDGVFLDDKNGKVTTDFVFAGQNQNQNIIIDDKGKNNDVIVAGTNNGVFLDDKNGKNDIIIPGQNQHQTVKTNLVTNTFAPTVFSTRPRVFNTGHTFVNARTDFVSHPTVFADTKGKNGVTLF